MAHIWSDKGRLDTITYMVRRPSAIYLSLVCILTCLAKSERLPYIDNKKVKKKKNQREGLIKIDIIYLKTINLPNDFKQPGRVHGWALRSPS